MKKFVVLLASIFLAGCFGMPEPSAEVFLDDPTSSAIDNGSASVLVSTNMARYTSKDIATLNFRAFPEAAGTYGVMVLNRTACVEQFASKRFSCSWKNSTCAAVSGCEEKENPLSCMRNKINCDIPPDAGAALDFNLSESGLIKAIYTGGGIHRVDVEPKHSLPLKLLSISGAGIAAIVMWIPPLLWLIGFIGLPITAYWYFHKR